MIDRPDCIIDAHTHVVSHDTVRYPFAPLSGKQSDWSRDRPVGASDMLAAMDAAGIARASLVQASTCYGHDNRYVAAVRAAHPARFAGVFSVDLAAGSAADNIRHWRGQGLRSARVFIAGHTSADPDAKLDDAGAYAAWELLQAEGTVLNVQIRADKLPQLESLLERFPRIKIVLDHFARPVLEDGAPYAQAAHLFSLARFPNLFFKYTTHTVRDAGAGRSTPAEFA